MKRNIKEIVFAVSVIVILVSITYRLSYAYFVATVTGNSTATASTIGAGTLNVNFTTSQYVSNDSLMLISDADKATSAEKMLFSVSQATATTVAARYNVYLTELSISNNFKSSDFKWELLRNSSVIASGNFTTAVSGTDFKLNSTALDLAVNATDNLELRLWLSQQDYDQLSLTNGTFSAKVKIEALAGA